MAYTKQENWGTFPACGYGGACIATFSVEYNNRSFGRDTGNCERALISGRLECACYGSNLGWASVPGNACHRAHLSSSGDTSRGNWDWCTDKGPRCTGNFDYRHVMSNSAGCYINKDSDHIAIDYYWQFTPSSYGWQYIWTPWFYLNDNERIYPPESLSVTWPSSIGSNVSASISKWSKNVNIGGTPTSYPNAKYWNWAVDLLNTSGTMLAHYANNYYESKSVSMPTNAWYTASGLPGSSAAIGSAYTIQKNSAYKLRVVVNNSFNQQLSATSPTLYSAPPKPNVTINSMVYVPTSKDCTLNFSWSKPTDGGAYTETIKYDVYDAKGNYYKSGVQLGTVSGGGSRSGTVTVTGLPSGEQYFVRVYVTATSGTGSTTKTVYAPVANAAFLGFEWDDVRRTCTIRAEAPGAANCRIQAGYSSNVYNVGNKLTSGQIGTLVVKDLNHGSGQILYLQAVPEASDGHQYTNEIAKISIPIPNPILGVHTPSCEKIEAGAEKEYIVDIIEKKKGSSTCTQRWQNGDRVVKKDKCLPVIPPEGGVSLGPVLPANDTTNMGTSNYVAEVGEQTSSVVCNNAPTVYMRLQRPCYMTVEMDWPALFPDIDFNLPTTTVSSGTGGRSSPSVDGQNPLHKSTYNKTTHKSVIELGSPKPFSGIWKCWNTSSRVNFSTANENFYVEIELGGLDWATVYNPQQFVFAIVVSRGGTKTYFGGVKEETLHLTDSTS